MMEGDLEMALRGLGVKREDLGVTTEDLEMDTR